MTRLLLSLLIIFIVSCGLTACAGDHGTADISTPNLYQARHNAALGMKALHNGHSDIAVEKLQLASEQAPQDPLVLAAWGYFYEKSGDLDRANSYYAYATVVAGRSGTIRNMYGAFLCRNGYPAESISHFLKAAETPHYNQADYAMANARYCAEQIKRGLGGNDEYAYYTRLVWQQPPISSTANGR